MKNIKSSLSIKLLAFSLLSVVALWSYTPSSSISSIKATIATNTTSSRTGVSHSEYFYKDGSAIYSVLPSLNQFKYTVNGYATVDWWFVFTTPNGSTANVALDFSGVYALTAGGQTSEGQTADIGIFIDYNGDTIEGIVNGLTYDKPKVDVDYDFTLSDGTTGVLTYSPAASQFTISIN